MDETGRPSFQRLQARMGLTKPRDIARAMARVPVRAVFFDCLRARGPRPARAAARRSGRSASRASCRRSASLQRGDHVLEHGPRRSSTAADGAGLEGIVAKRSASRYAGGASARLDQDQVPAAAGVRDRRLHRAAGLARRTSARSTSASTTAARLRLRDQGRHAASTARRSTGSGRARAAPPRHVAVRGRRPTGRGHHWVEPRLVCEVRFTEWTRDGGLRHPIFLGLRDRQEAGGLPPRGASSRRTGTPELRAAARRAGASTKARSRAPAAGPHAARCAAPIREVTLTNLEEGVLAGRRATPRAI